jgi:hypothetical protein
LRITGHTFGLLSINYCDIATNEYGKGRGILQKRITAKRRKGNATGSPLPTKAQAKGKELKKSGQVPEIIHDADWPFSLP